MCARLKVGERSNTEPGGKPVMSSRLTFVAKVGQPVKCLRVVEQRFLDVSPWYHITVNGQVNPLIPLNNERVQDARYIRDSLSL